MTAEIAGIARATAPKGRDGAVGDTLFRALSFFFALLVLLILGGVIVSLVGGALPALRAFGLSFVATEVWNPVTQKFGALAVGRHRSVALAQPARRFCREEHAGEQRSRRGSRHNESRGSQRRQRHRS